MQLQRTRYAIDSTADDLTTYLQHHPVSLDAYKRGTDIQQRLMRPSKY